MSSWLRPDYFPNIWVGNQNLLKRLGEPCELWCRVYLLEEPLHDGSAGVSEAKELVIIPILVSATKGQPKSLVAYRDVPTPILRHHLFRLNASLRETLNKMLSKPLTPETWINLHLFALVRREFGGSKSDFGLHGTKSVRIALTALRGHWPVRFLITPEPASRPPRGRTSPPVRPPSCL